MEVCIRHICQNPTTLSLLFLTRSLISINFLITFLPLPLLVVLLAFDRLEMVRDFILYITTRVGLRPIGKGVKVGTPIYPNAPTFFTLQHRWSEIVVNAWLKLVDMGAEFAGDMKCEVICWRIGLPFGTIDTSTS